MAPNSKQSEKDTETHATTGVIKTNRLHANWATMPVSGRIHDGAVSQQRGSALHMMALQAAQAFDLKDTDRAAHCDNHRTGAPAEKRTTGDLGQLFERRPNRSDERSRNSGAIDDLQQKLKKQVGSIEDFIKLKLAAAVNKPTVTSAGEGLLDKLLEQKSFAPLPVKLVVEQVRSDLFAQKAQDMFARLDINKTAMLTRSDLAKSLQDPTIKGAEAQVLAAIYGNFDKLARTDGAALTIKDLQDYGKTERLYAQETEMANRLARKAANPNSSFVRALGITSGQFVTQDRLTEIDNTAPMRPEDRELVEYMITHFDSIANAHGDRYSWAKHGISLDDMTDYSGKVWNAERFQVVNSVNATLRRTNDSQNHSCDSLYADQANPLNSITADAIKQGTIGDCYFEAAVASVAHFNPKSIKNMIKDNLDGSYTVTFPGAWDEPLTVLAPTEAERGLYNNGSPAGTWASVLEKANGLYAQQHFWRRNVLANCGGGDSPSEGGDGGGLGNGLQRLTGNPVDMHLLALEKREALRACLDESINAKCPKSVITFTGPDLPMMRTTPGNFAKSHVYTILAFDPNGADGGTLTIRNPWGNDESGPRGLARISFDEYASNFCGFFAEI